MALKIFCHAGCREAYIGDRKCGIIYPPAKMLAGDTASRYPAHVRMGQCPYCRAPVVKYRQRRTVEAYT